MTLNFSFLYFLYSLLAAFSVRGDVRGRLIAFSTAFLEM
jgi:hypothetical protein